MGLDAEKAALRRECLRIRSAVRGRGEKDRAIYGHVTALREWREAQRVYLYLSAKGEPDTFALARAAWESGKEVLAPVCGGEVGQMDFYAFTGFEQLRPGKWGILEPDPQICRPSGRGKGPCLCLVPGLAFGRDGARLGYGKGYYDRFLAAMEIDTVGLCFQELLLDRVPAGIQDKRVGLVATEAGVTVCAREGSKL